MQRVCLFSSVLISLSYIVFLKGSILCLVMLLYIYALPFHLQPKLCLDTPVLTILCLNLLLTLLYIMGHWIKFM